MSEDNRVFEEIYAKYSAKILSYIRSKINSKEDAEDLQALVFTKALEKFEIFDPAKSAVSTWLYTIANNTVIDYFRTRHVSEELDENSEIEFENAGFDDILNEETLNELADALEKLDEELRDLIILRYYHDLTLKEISEKMDISYGKCKLMHNSALMELKSLMKGLV
ncbi:MAG: RNA polymerase sigma factor [Lachnospiraceae bacterium]|nr:RNA polymerase sigma factor [Lachnospiraceae bacterium]